MHSRPTLDVRPTLAAIALFCSLPLVASAQDAEEYSREGSYLGMSATYSMEQFRDTDGFASVDDGWHVGLTGGYRLNQFAAIELELDVPVQPFDLDTAPGVTPTGEQEIETLLLMFNQRLHFPLGRVEPFVLFGVGMMWANPSPDNNDGVQSLNSQDGRVDFAIQAGGGFDIYITPAVALTLDAAYVVPTDHLAPLNYVTYNFGFKYRFGGGNDEDE